MRKLFWTLIVILAVTFSGFFGFGMNLPKTHVFKVEGLYDAPKDAVWKAITDYEKLPDWSDNVVRTERQHDLEGKPVWRLYAPYGRFMDLQIVDEDSGLLHVADIVDSNYPFAGRWEFRLIAGQDNKTMVELREEGVIESPFWRVIIRHIVGQKASAEAFMRELGNHLESSVDAALTESQETEVIDAEQESEKPSEDEHIQKESAPE